jgi:putative ABC transport system permease protein
MRFRAFSDYFVQDLMLAIRSAGRRPAFTAVLLAVLILGIGLTTSIFSVFYGVLLRPLLFRDPSRLVLVKQSLPEVVPFPINMPPAHALELARSGAFQDSAIFVSRARNVEGEPPERVNTLRASWRLLPLLGLTPTEGRNFTEEEDRSSVPVALVSETLATRRFGARQALGRTILLDKRRYQIIGVLPALLAFPTHGMQQGGSADVWVPLSLTADERAMGNVDYSYSLLARLADRVTTTQAREAARPSVDRIISALPAPLRPHAQVGVSITPLQDELVGGSRRLLFMLLGAVGALLLITCLNVSNMLLSRSVARRREIAVRAALGASSRRLIWQMVQENVFLFLVGGALGAVLAIWSQQAFLRLLPPDLPRTQDIGIDVTVLMFTLALSVTTGLIFGLAPALGSLQIDLRTSLQEASRGTSGGRLIGTMRRSLVIAQIAFTAMLLATAGLLVKSFFRVLDEEAALRTEQVVTFGLALSDEQYPKPESTETFYRELRQRLQQMPGVRSVGLGTDIPLEGRAGRLISPEQPGSGPQSVVLDYTAIEGDYFQSLNVRLFAGRLFSEQDRAGGEMVAIVNEAFARTFWPGRSALNHRFKIGPPSYASAWLRIVGVVENLSARTAGAVAPHAYVPLAQEPMPSFRQQASFVIRTASPGMSLDNVVRQTVRSLDPSLPVLSLRSMGDVVSGAVAPRSGNAQLVALFGVAALLLSALGVYGVVAYSVSERTRDIGVRLALGASRSTVWTSVVWEGARLALVGLALGLPGAFAAGHLIRTFLYGVAPLDVSTFSLVLAAVSSTTVAATLIPGWRAVHVDPIVALRIH